MSNEINVPKTYSELEGNHKRIETEVLISEDLKLSLITYQNVCGGKALVTYASASKRLPTRGAGDAFLYGHSIGHDYHRVFATNKVRCTANAVKTQHATHLAYLANIIEDAKKYYGVTIVKLVDRVSPWGDTGSKRADKWEET